MELSERLLTCANYRHTAGSPAVESMGQELPTGRTPRGNQRDPAEPDDTDSLQGVAAAFRLSVLLPLAYCRCSTRGWGAPNVSLSPEISDFRDDERRLAEPSFEPRSRVVAPHIAPPARFFARPPSLRSFGLAALVGLLVVNLRSLSLGHGHRPR